MLINIGSEIINKIQIKTENKSKIITPNKKIIGGYAKIGFLKEITCLHTEEGLLSL